MIGIKNTIRAALDRRLIVHAEGEPFSGKARRWMRSLESPETERSLLHNSPDLLDAFDRRIAAVDAQLLQAASVERHARLPMTIAGVGAKVAVGLLATIRDVHASPPPISWWRTWAWSRA